MLPVLHLLVAGRTSTTVDLKVEGAGDPAIYKSVSINSPGTAVDFDITGGTIAGLTAATAVTIKLNAVLVDGRTSSSVAVGGTTCPKAVANAAVCSSETRTGACTQVCAGECGGDDTK